MAMRRGWVVLGATAFGLAGLLAFDQHQFGTPFALYDAKATKQHFKPKGGFGGASGATTTPPAPATTDQAAPATTDQAAPATTDQIAPATTAQAPPTTQQQAAPSTQRALGDAVGNPYGTVQVRVTVKGTNLANVVAVNMPYSDPTSQSITDQVAPVLAQQAISAQSAQISGVSGATYTSDAYRQSLQSALDKINFGK